MWLHSRPPRANGPQRPEQAHAAMSIDASIAWSVARSTSSPTSIGDRMYWNSRSAKANFCRVVRMSWSTATVSSSGEAAARLCRASRRLRAGARERGGLCEDTCHEGKMRGRRWARESTPKGTRGPRSAHNSLSWPSCAKRSAVKKSRTGTGSGSPPGDTCNDAPGSVHASVETKRASREV